VTAPALGGVEVCPSSALVGPAASGAIDGLRLPLCDACAPSARVRATGVLVIGPVLGDSGVFPSSTLVEPAVGVAINVLPIEIVAHGQKRRAGG
jgi:hypothetical protein